MSRRKKLDSVIADDVGLAVRQFCTAQIRSLSKSKEGGCGRSGHEVLVTADVVGVSVGNDAHLSGLGRIEVDGGAGQTQIRITLKESSQHIIECICIHPSE